MKVKKNCPPQPREAFCTMSGRCRRVDGNVCAIFVPSGAGHRSPEGYGSNLTLVDAGASRFASRNSMQLDPLETLISQSAKDYWVKMLPKLQDPDFSETSVSGDERSESFVSSNSEVVENEPAIEGGNEDIKTRKKKKSTAAGFHGVPRPEFLSESSMNSQGNLITDTIGAQLILLETFPQDNQEALP